MPMTWLKVGDRVRLTPAIVALENSPGTVIAAELFNRPRLWVDGRWIGGEERQVLRVHWDLNKNPAPGFYERTQLVFAKGPADA